MSDGVGKKIKDFLFTPQSEVTRNIAKGQFESSRSKNRGTLGQTNQDKIKLAQAGLENTMLANRQRLKENQSTDTSQ